MASETSPMLLHAKAQTRDPAVDALVAAVREVWTMGAMAGPSVAG